MAEMGWHTITIWECELKPKLREQTLESLAYTLNHIWLEDRSLSKPQASQGKCKNGKIKKLKNFGGQSIRYDLMEDEEYLMAAEEEETLSGGR